MRSFNLKKGNCIQVLERGPYKGGNNKKEEIFCELSEGRGRTKR